MSDEELDTVEQVEAQSVGDDAVVEVAIDGGDASADKSKRGRPRDPQAETRDEQVREALAEGPQSREQLATKLGLEGNLVYLSLWRLRKSGIVEKVETEGVKRGWQLVTATAD